MKPLVFDFFCGLGGWTESFLNEGYRCIGFDIEAHDYGKGGYPGELVLADIRTLKGADLVAKYGAPNCMVASPPCQEFSYMAMPWSKAKAKLKLIENSPKEQERLTDLFRQCFRIQKEIIEACGHHVPMVVENVRGAQRWVGKAQWNFGSFYLWGDVPALLPIARKFKTHGMNWSDRSKRGQDFTRIAGQQAMEGVKLPTNNSARRWEDRDVKRLCDANEGCKNFTPNGELLGKNTLGRRYSSKSKKRKEVSAMIAKIPPALASWIAKVFMPNETTNSK